MVKALSQFWWTLLLRGLVAVAFAVMLWMRPGISLAGMIIFLGGYMVADGVISVFTAIGGRKDNPDWGWMMAGGIVGALVGCLILRSPGTTAIVLVMYLAVWAMVVGVTQIAVAIRVRHQIDNEWLLVLGGLAMVALGVFILWAPGVGALGMVWTIATFAFLFGLLMIFAAFRLRGITGKVKDVAEKVMGKA